MTILKAYYLFWIVDICCFNCIWAGASQSFNIKREDLNKRLVSGIFSDVTVENYHDCARACFNFGGKCKSINFNRKNKLCELNAKGRELVDDSEFEKNGEFIFSDIKKWPKLMTGGCSNENCLDHQKCRQIGKNDFQCVNKANCGEASPIGNGTVSAPVTLDGATAIYTCNFGFENNGKFTKKKCVEGIWTSETITCTIKDCGTLANIAYGTVSATSTTHGSTATYSCQYGYEHVSGDLTRNCVDGTWDGIESACTAKDCGSLSTISHGDISVQYTTHGSTAQYICDSDYQITSGHPSRTCDNGWWTGNEAVCTPIPNVGCYISGQANQYHGIKQYTVGGLFCQRWDSQSPHEHDRTYHHIPDSSLYDAHNYCRDADFHGTPWCYTTDPGTRWENCDIPIC